MAEGVATETISLLQAACALKLSTLQERRRGKAIENLVVASPGGAETAAKAYGTLLHRNLRVARNGESDALDQLSSCWHARRASSVELERRSPESWCYRWC